MFVFVPQDNFPPYRKAFCNRQSPLQKATISQNAELYSLVLTDVSTTHKTKLRLRDHCRRRGQQNRKFAVKLCLPGISEAIHIKSYQCYLSSMSKEKKTCQQGQGKTQEVSTTNKELQTTKECREQEKVLTGNNIPTVYLIPNGYLQTYLWVTSYGLNITVFMFWGIYVCNN